jgi:hypothetical protein
MSTLSPNPFVATASAVGVATENHEMSTGIFATALACGIWYFFILLVQAIGVTQLYVELSIGWKAMLTVTQIPVLLLETKTSCIAEVEDRRCSACYHLTTRQGTRTAAIRMPCGYLSTGISIAEIDHLLLHSICR